MIGLFITLVEWVIFLVVVMAVLMVILDGWGIDDKDT